MRLLVIALFAACVVLVTCSRSEPISTLSFHPPLDEKALGHWNLGGDATITENGVRLTPAMPSRAGFMWSRSPMQSDGWSVTLEFRIHGNRGPGGDGLALWYVKQPTNDRGPVFGGPESWVGLGLFLDTYDNDNKRNNPWVSAIVSDGTARYPHDSDNLISEQAGTGCLQALRNVRGNSKLRVVYDHRVLQVLVDGVGSGQWAQCLSMPYVELPAGYYFGVTAATGAVSDNHDVISLDISSEIDEDEQKEPEETADPNDQFLSLRERLAKMRRLRDKKGTASAQTAPAAAAQNEPPALKRAEPPADVKVPPPLQAQDDVPPTDAEPEVFGAGRNAAEEESHHHTTGKTVAAADTQRKPAAAASAYGERLAGTPPPAANRQATDEAETGSEQLTRLQTALHHSVGELKSDLHGIVAELGRLKHFIADSLPAAAADGAGAPAAAVVDTSALETELHALKEDTGVVRNEVSLARAELSNHVASLRERLDNQRTQMADKSSLTDTKRSIDELRDAVHAMQRSLRETATAQQSAIADMATTFKSALASVAATVSSSGSGLGVIGWMLLLVAMAEGVALVLLWRRSARDHPKRFI